MPSPHRHAELEINLVTAGRSAYLLADQRCELVPNTLIWLFPGQDHILLEESPDYAMWTGVFKPALLERVCPLPPASVLRGFDPPGSWQRRMKPGVSSRLQALFQEVTDTGNDPMRRNAGLCYLLLTAWAAFETAEDMPGGAVHPAVKHAARLLRDAPETVSVEQIGHDVGLSGSRLSRLFHTQIGMTVTAFRNQQRLQRFLRGYGQGSGVTLLDAALEAGFGSYPQFYRVFTELMGCTPAEYRRQKQR